MLKPTLSISLQMKMQDSHSDVQQVHLCDLGEVDYWALVNNLSLNFQSLCGDILTRLVITTPMRFWKMQKPNILWDKTHNIYEKHCRNLVLVMLTWWALWSYSDRLGKSQRQIVQTHGVFIFCRLQPAAFVPNSTVIFHGNLFISSHLRKTYLSNVKPL